MFTFFKRTNTYLGEADFFIKSAFGVSVVSCLILLPFGINNFAQGRTLGGVITIFVSILFAFNAFACWRGRYALYLNLYVIVPAFTLGAVNAITTLKIVGSYWSYLCVFAIYFILPYKYTKYANAAFLVAVISAAWFSLDTSVFLRFSVVLVGASLAISISNREITKAQTLLKKQAVTDVLTGTFNRVQLPESLESAIHEFKSNSVKSTLCIIDIDHFKDINDNYGHDAGDNVLIALAAVIPSVISGKDLLFRIGGEEFLILMNNTNVNESRKTAEALRAVVKELPLLDNHEVTISIGITEVKVDYDWRKWMKHSDEKLYIAKRNGRDQVVI